MSKKVPRNAPCPCGSGKKYKQCCIGKDFDWIETDDGEIARQVPLSEEAFEAFENLKQLQRAQSGREPERIFEGAPPLEHMEHWTVEAMKKSGVDPAIIYAFEKTGLLLSDHNINKIPDSEVEEWEAAVDEFSRTSGQTPKRRRLNDADLAEILNNGPAERRPGEFVTRLPFPPPFEKASWGGQRISDLKNSPEFFDYLGRCITEITRSGRGETYLKMFLLMTHAGPSKDLIRDYDGLLAEAQERVFTADELSASIEMIAASFGPKGAAPNAAAAFEFLAFIEDFLRSYAEKCGLLETLRDGLQRINELSLGSFLVAVNVELGIGQDIWKP